MRILFLTNFYPPHELGGQGLSCRQIVEGLAQRGHETAVLTSMHGIDNAPQVADNVYRLLYLEMDLVPWRQSITFFLHRRRRERENLRRFRETAAQFDPDVVFIWGMWNLPRSLPARAEALYSDAVVYRFADYWPTLPNQHELYWRTTGRTWLSRLPKRILGHIALKLLEREEQPTLRFAHAICVSAATRDALIAEGVPIEHARIIHSGIDVEQYQRNHVHTVPTNGDRHLQLLYAGRLTAEKGVETAIKAVGRIFRDGHHGVRLRLAGRGSTDYEAHLRRLIDQEKIGDYVALIGQVPQHDMPDLFHSTDVLLVPSVWPEPFARTVLEGMAAGCAVVATNIGGTSEIVTDGETGLLYAPGDADALAQCIVDLSSNAELRRRLATAGRRLVALQFTTTTMMDAYETYLQEVHENRTNEAVIAPRATPHNATA